MSKQIEILKVLPVPFPEDMLAPPLHLLSLLHLSDYSAVIICGVAIVIYHRRIVLFTLSFEQTVEIQSQFFDSASLTLTSCHHNHPTPYTSRQEYARK